MEILNYFPEKKLSELFDFLGFVSIYEDRERTKNYFKMMEAARKKFAGAVVVEAGAGFGEFTEKAVKMGAKKAYAVEINKYMHGVLAKKFAGSKHVKVVKKDITEFVPPGFHADVLIHDLFGPLMYDESLFALGELKFDVATVMPNGARVVMALLDSKKFTDEVVTPDVLGELRGALVADLFEPYTGRYPYEVCSWSSSEGIKHSDISLAGKKGDLLVFCLEIYHDQKFVCSARESTNWPIVWTPRAGDRFRLRFKRDGIYCNPVFEWIE